MPFIVGFVTFALICLYQDMDISRWLREKISMSLANQGWDVDREMQRRPGPWPLIARFVWKLSTCPYCLGVWVSFAATWYALSVHPWHRAFWLTWWAAWGVHVVLYRTYQVLSEVHDAIDRYLDLSTPDGAASDRQPAAEDTE